MNEILSQGNVIARMLDVKVVCVFDQALHYYGKMKNNAHNNCRNGWTICNFQVTKGKRFKNTRLRDITFESAVIAEGLIEAVLEGRQYNRAVRLHKIIYKSSPKIYLESILLLGRNKSF